ncbi:MAG: hypothetical protein ACREPM_24565 [Gemmatimonadaceae bacterium]
MADDTLHYCSICNRPVYSAYHFVVRSKLDGDQELYDLGCTECGEYRISADGEAAMSRQADTRRAALLRLIKEANARGNRYCANDGRETPISTIATPRDIIKVPTPPPSQTQAPRLAE